MSRVKRAAGALFGKLTGRKRVQSTAELRAKAGLISQVIREAQADGDERWRDLLPQQLKLNELLVEAIDRERRAAGIPAPPNVTIGLGAATAKARRMEIVRAGPNGTQTIINLDTLPIEELEKLGHALEDKITACRGTGDHKTADELTQVHGLVARAIEKKAELPQEGQDDKPAAAVVGLKPAT